MKTKLFTFFLALVASVGTIFAWDYEYVQIGDLYYNLDAANQTAAVTSQLSWSDDNYSGLTAATIPASVAYDSVSYSVTSIGDRAFYGCSSLTSVTLPNSVTSIGDYAFFGCSGLTSIEIPNSVTSIGYDAFEHCSGLTSVTIPNSVTSIGDYAFYGCSSLTSVTLPNSVTSIGDRAFYGCSSLTSVTIPNSVTSIGDRAFYDCSGLTSPVYNTHVFAFMPTSYSGAFTIPDGIESIADGAFVGCSGLTSIEIPNSVTSIGYDAFEHCSGLTSVTIPNSVTSIGDYAFYGCSGLTSVTIPNSVTSIGYRAFKDCDGLTSLKLSAKLEEPDRYSDYTLIAGYYQDGRHEPDRGYEWLKNLISIEAPAWFFDVPETDWIYCPRNLQHVAVNNGELTDNVLVVINRSYKTLQTLDVSGATNTEFADEAFKGYYNLTEVKLPAGLQKVSYMMVAGCKNLQSIEIPASVEEIEQSAFEDCRSIQTITFGGAPAGAPGRFNAPAASTSQLRRIGNWAFYNAHELQNLEIPEGVTEIGDGAFYGCTYLEEMVLPSSVQSIGDNCFALCAKLTKITCNAVTPPTIQAKTFYDVKRQIPVYVPDECVDAYKNDVYWQEFDIQGQSNMPHGLEEISSSLQGGDRGRLILHNGQILILRGDKTYTLQGQEVK